MHLYMQVLLALPFVVFANGCFYFSGEIACSAGVFFERAICLRKRHVETSLGEEEMGRVKGSGEGVAHPRRPRGR